MTAIHTTPPPPLVVMGVCGSGKTTVGAALAGRLGLPFADADDLHPPANVARMRPAPRSPTPTACPGSTPSGPGWARAPAPGR